MLGSPDPDKAIHALTTIVPILPDAMAGIMTSRPMVASCFAAVEFKPPNEHIQSHNTLLSAMASEMTLLGAEAIIKTNGVTRLMKAFAF
jgi:hypothetical protein